MKFRRRLSSSDLPKEDRRAHKHSKHGSRGRSDHRADESDMASGTNNHSDSRRKSLHRYDGDVESDADEDLTRNKSSRSKSSRRMSRHEEKASIYRQLKEAERVQRKVAPSDLSSEQEIHIHYLPIISSSPTNPFSSRHRSLSPPNKHEIRKSKSQTTSVTNKRSTMSRSNKQERPQSRSRDPSRKRSPRRSKHGHEKYGKHGKKADPYLEPLRQRWICYECGKIRSDTIDERHPLGVNQKMQPNWCGRCRITRERKGKPLDWYGQRHYCWGCGIVRSEKYHRDNQIAPGESPGPNYCRPCREASPSYEKNLREASEVGGESAGFDKAFMRQVHDANLSDIEEDKDDCTRTANRAPGKENDAREALRKTAEATSSILKNRSFNTKTSSDTSSEDHVPVEKLREMYLEADKMLNFGGKAGGGGARLSAGSSYKPPSVESASGCSSAVVGDVKTYHVSHSAVGGDVKTYHVPHRDIGHLARAGGNGDCEMKDGGFDTADKPCKIDSNPAVRAFAHGPHKAASPIEVHQSDSGSRPTTCGTDNSGLSCNFASGTSRSSVASIRCRPRRNPAETSTGSPPERDGFTASKNIGDDLRYNSRGSGPSAQRPIPQGAHGLPSYGTFGEVPERDGMAGGYASGRAQSGFPMPPTPPDDSSNSMGPGKARGHGPHHGTDGFASGSAAEYASRPDRPHHSFDSAAHFSDAHCRRDFSGNSYYDHAAEDKYEYKPSYPGNGFAQPAQSFQPGNQTQYRPHAQYGPHTQYAEYGPHTQYAEYGPHTQYAKYGPHTQYTEYGPHTQYAGYGPHTQYAEYGSQAQHRNEFHGQYGHQAQYNGGDFSRQGQAFGGSGNPASQESDLSGTGQGTKGWATDGDYVPTQEEIHDYLQRAWAPQQQQQGEPQTTPRAEPQWEIYEDENDGATEEQMSPRADAFAWRDGKTSVHHVNSATPGNTVTILSIHEITSDDDLSTMSGGDDDSDDDHDSDALSSLTATQAG